VRELPAGWVGADGTIVSCANDSHELSAVDGVTGTPRFRIKLPGSCPWDGPLDNTRRYVLLTNGVAGELFQLVTLVELRTGRAYQLEVTHVPSGIGAPAVGLALINPSPEGPELVAVGNVGVSRSRPATARNDLALLQSVAWLGDAAFSDDGTLVAVHFNQAEQNHAGLEVYALPAQRRVAGGPGTPLADLDLHQIPGLTFTPDDRYLLARASNDDLLVISTSEYTADRRIRPPVPEAVGPTPPLGWNTSFVPLGGDEVAVLYAGAFTRWRLTTGEQIGDPLPLRDDATELREDAQQVQASIRPGHPGQVFVTMSDGVELWDLDARRAVRSFRPEPNTKMAGALNSSSLVAVHTGSARLYLWDPDRGGPVHDPGPLPADRNMIGIGPDDLLVLKASSGHIEFWDMRSGRTIATVDTPGVTGSWHIVGHTLLGLSGDGLLSLNLDRKTALSRLCAFNDRPYTPEESNLLPDGAARTPPCHIAAR
jgi:hypothetical protein